MNSETWLAVSADSTAEGKTEEKPHFKTFSVARRAERMALSETAKPRKRKRVPKRLRSA